MGKNSTIVLVGLVLCGAAALHFFRAPEKSRTPAAENASKTAFADIPLADADAKPLKISDLRGRWVAVFFGFLTCPDICPTTLSWAAREFRALGDKANGVELLFVSVDPKRDDPESLGKYVRHFNPNFRAATGTEENLRVLARGLGAHFEYEHKSDDTASGDYGVHHSGAVYLLSPDGKLAETLSPPLESTALSTFLDRKIARRTAPLMITDAVIRVPPPGGRTTAAYLALSNASDDEIRVTSATIDGADRVEFHATRKSPDGMMSMARMPEVKLAPRARVEFVPGGMHIMVMGIKRELIPGSKVAMTLGMSDGRTQMVEADVRAN